jgi:hypothetical protein
VRGADCQDGPAEQKDTAKVSGSMVVYVTKVGDARRVVNGGFFYAGGESGYTGRLYSRAYGSSSPANEGEPGELQVSWVSCGEGHCVVNIRF